MRRCLGFVLLLMLCGSTAFSTTLLFKDFGDLVSESDGIIQGTVTSIESRYDADKEIYTFVTLDSIEPVHGKYDRKQLGLRLKGGNIDGDILNVHGSPSFEIGESVVLFLNGNGTNIVPIVGWTQGTFEIEYDATTQEKVVKDHAGNAVFDIEGNKIIKESRFQDKARIVDLKGRSLPAQAHEGTPENGKAIERRPDVVPARSAMSLDRFIESVKTLALKKGKPELFIQSVAIGDFRNTGSKIDAGPGKAGDFVPPTAPTLPKSPRQEIIQPDHQ